MDNKNRFYVYCHQRKTDGKCFYIGKGTGKRYKSKYGRNIYWNRIVNKHGFVPIILINNISERKAFELEADFCKQIGYNNICNAREEFGNGGHSLSNETRRKISKAKKGHICYNDEWKRKIGEGNKGKIVSKESRMKMSKPKSEETKLKMKGPRQKQSQETIQKRTKSLTGKSKPEGFIKKLSEFNKKPILQYDLQGNFIREWEGIVDAAKQLKLNKTGISNNLIGVAKSCSKFIWKYKIK